MTQEEAIRRMTAQADAMLEASQDAYVQELQREWNEFQGRFMVDIAMIRDGIYKGEKPTYSDFFRAKGDLQIAQAVRGELTRMAQSINTSLYDSLVQQYKDAYNVSAWTVDESTPPNVDIDYRLPPEQQIRQFVSSDWEGEMFATRNEKEYYFLSQDLQKQVTLAMLQGESVKDLRDRIIDVIGKEDSDYRYRAERIARTELLRASNIARQDLYDKNEDIISDWVWITRALASGRLCEECAERSGHTYDEVVKIAASQDMALDPPAHPNCACTWAARPKKWADLLPPELADGMEDYPDPDQMVNPIMQQDGDFKYEKVKPMGYDAWKEKYLTPSEVGSL